MVRTGTSIEYISDRIWKCVKILTLKEQHSETIAIGFAANIGPGVDMLKSLRLLEL